MNIYIATWPWPKGWGAMQPESMRNTTFAQGNLQNTYIVGCVHLPVLEERILLAHSDLTSKSVAIKLYMSLCHSLCHMRQNISNVPSSNAGLRFGKRLRDHGKGSTWNCEFRDLQRMRALMQCRDHHNNYKNSKSWSKQQSSLVPSINITSLGIYHTKAYMFWGHGIKSIPCLQWTCMNAKLYVSEDAHVLI